MATTIVAILFVVTALLYFFARATQCRREGLLALDAGSLFSPWCVNVVHWTVILALFYLLPVTLLPLTSRFWTSLVLWIVILGLTSWFCYSALPARKSSERTIRVSPIGYDALLIIALILTPLYLWKVYQQVKGLGGENLMLDLRWLALQEKDYGLVAYCVVINQVLFVASVWAGKHLQLWKRLLPTLLYLLCGLAIMEKGSLVFMVLVMVLAYYERGIIKIKHIAYVVAAVVVLAFAFTLQRAGEQQQEAKEMDGIEWFLATYMTSPPSAYCHMAEKAPQETGGNTFTFFYYIANKLHLGHHKVEPRVQPFIEVPVSTNTYTIFQPFYLDFGQGGVAFFAFVYGIILGVCYRYHRNGNALATILYAYMIALFCLQFHQEELFLGAMRLIQFVFFALIATLPKWNKSV